MAKFNCARRIYYNYLALPEAVLFCLPPLLLALSHYIAFAAILYLYYSLSPARCLLVRQFRPVQYNLVHYITTLPVSSRLLSGFSLPHALSHPTNIGVGLPSHSHTTRCSAPPSQLELFETVQPTLSAPSLYLAVRVTI